MKGRSRPSHALRLAVRAGALSAVGAAVAVPLLRRRLRIPTSVTVTAVAVGPLALAVLKPRSKRRDVALFAMQMWAFTVAHELPYDDPERLRSRLRTRYPIRSDRLIGAGRLPNARLQRGLARLPQVGALDKFLAWTHWLWFIEPYVVAGSGSWSATTTASRARPGRWRRSSISAASSTSRSRRRRRGGPRSRG